MADATYSVKVSEEVQEQLKKHVAESGLNNKDFFNNLLSIYETQKAKESTPVLTADIEELESLTRRINGIFVNVAERINTIQRENAGQLMQAQENSTSTIGLLSQRIKTYEQERIEDEERIQEFIEDKEKAEAKAADLESRLKSFEQAAQDKQALIDEYKEKLDTQTGIVNEYKDAFGENKKLHQEIADFKRKNEELERQVNILKEKAAEQATRHTADMEQLKETLNIERDKTIIELRTEYQQQLQEQQETYNEKVKSLLERLESQQAEYQKQMLERLESQQTVRSKTPAKANNK